MVTIGMAVVALALLAALLAQDGLFSGSMGDETNPDGLTTLALVLAILAFLIQIFVFVFQTNASTASLQRSEELNAETQAVLSKIEANSDATQRVLFSQFERLLDYVVGPTAKEKEGAEDPAFGLGDGQGPDPEDDQQPATVADMRRVMGEWTRSLDRPSFAVSSEGAASKEDQRIVEQLRAWPSREEAEGAVAELETLPPLALAALTQFARAEISQRLSGGRIGLRESGLPGLVSELVEKGLIKRDDGFLTLTERGREVVRVLPTGKPTASRPSWMDEVLEPLWKGQG